ncbi:MAG: NUDIX hydrolase [Bacteroidia bacterium]|nr:NUDIX hydrolase [Bacteroidia bacterium]
MSLEANPWHTERSRLVYDNPWIRVTEHAVRTPAGTSSIYGVVSPKNLAIGILPVDPQGYTWLVGQWRYPLGLYSWEIPEGGCPLGSDPLETAQRELAEETGLRAGKWALLQTLHLSNSISDETAYLYLAQDLRPGTAHPEETEVLQLRHLPLAEAYQWVREGRITDALSVIALQTAELRGL